VELVGKELQTHGEAGATSSTDLVVEDKAEARRGSEAQMQVRVVEPMLQETLALTRSMKLALAAGVDIAKAEDVLVTVDLELS
jgi:hypothetical protein